MTSNRGIARVPRVEVEDFLASVERLMEDVNTDFVLGAPDADTPAARTR